MTTHHVRASLLAATAAASFALLAACGTTATTSSATSTTPSTTSTETADSVAGMPMPTAPAGPHQPADVTFAQQMTVHHRGAIEMADLAPTRASSAQVKALAAEIKAAQAPEIAQMAGWLAAWAPSTDMNGMPNTTAASPGAMDGMGGTGTMPGMMTDAQMTALTAASGTAFDKLFLQLMIGHHEGALTMARTETAQGVNPEALALAKSITTSQSAQITRMKSMLAGM